MVRVVRSDTHDDFAWLVSVFDEPPYFHMKTKVIAKSTAAKKYSDFAGAV
jgi:hypothetical protein